MPDAEPLNAQTPAHAPSCYELPNHSAFLHTPQLKVQLQNDTVVEQQQAATNTLTPPLHHPEQDLIGVVCTKREDTLDRTMDYIKEE